MFKQFEISSSIKDYEVKIIDSLENSLGEIHRDGDYIIVDRKLRELHPILNDLLGNYNKVIEIEALEKTKSYEGVIPFFDELITSGFKRNNRIIAIGGGITQDVSAFMASILYRGVEWIYFPTTLLAQGDSCIGSKTSINFKEYKNQVGNFYPPLSIYLDPSYLRSLEERDLRSGVGEMAHYFFVSGIEAVNFFEKEFETALKDQSNLSEIVERSLLIKKSYIEIDEFDRKERIVFNYGHTFGHAIESITSYGIPHGVAVSFGMDMANYISYKKGYITLEDVEKGHKIFSKIWKGYSISDIDLNQLFNAMEKDKKNENGKIGLILTKGWGKMFKDLTKLDQIFEDWMKKYMQEYHKIS